MVDTALFDLQEAAALCGGEYVGPQRPPVCLRVSLDSRDIREDDLFIPLKGEFTDGHLFIGEALQRGATGSLCERGYFEAHREELLELCGLRAGLLVVDDTLRAFQTMAERYLSRFSDLVRIGVTGSSGKTTTKEILGSIFSLYSSTVINQGNLNSESGLPLSVLSVRQDHRFGIFEMGINHPGEMEILARIVKPQAAVIVNIGSAHVGLLGSVDAIAEEKKKIFSYLGKTGVAFIPEDEPYAEFLTQDIDAEVITFGRRTTEGFMGAKSLGLHGWEMLFRDRIVYFPLIGEYNLRNALCGITVAQYFGLDDMTICSGLEHVQPLFGRGQILHGRSTVLHDCYNANPDSLFEALIFLHELEWDGRKIAILGAMKELGDETESAHEFIARKAGETRTDLVVLVGDEFKDAYEKVRDTREGDYLWFSGIEELERRVDELIRPGDIVLVKGSRAMALERITDYIV